MQRLSLQLAAPGLLLAVLLLAGCGGQKREKSTAAVSEEASVLSGEVVTADRVQKTIQLQQPGLPGRLPAGLQTFRLLPADAEIVTTGQAWRGETHQRNGDWWLEHLWPDDATTLRLLTATGQALAQDTMIRGRAAYREIGELIPDFTLLDQNARLVSANQWRGRQVVLNFIFTRCQVATMCPAATRRMQQLQQAAKAAGRNDVTFVTITFDPAYDSPGVLRAYATERGIDLGNFSLLTGPETTIQHLLTQFGVLRTIADGTIKHTATTVLIDRQGHIAYRAEGSAWTVEEFLERLVPPP
ncbi:MAG: SCO family protein [Opitutae bacterium]|nr:SCO family protein [Opitutae bacterium]